MQYVNANTRQSTNNINMMRMSSFVRNNPVVTNTSQPPPVPPTEPSEKKMAWGEPTWFLLHTLAEKVKESYFNNIKGELLQNIYNICNNLPCPMCAEHATEYIKSSTFFRINSKAELKNFLYIFHNVINAKKGFPVFDYGLLNEKYAAASTKYIIYNFMQHFQKRNKNMKMLANDMYRMRVVNYLKTWFNNNIIYFDE